MAKRYGKTWFDKKHRETRRYEYSGTRRRIQVKTHKGWSSAGFKWQFNPHSKSWASSTRKWR